MDLLPYAHAYILIHIEIFLFFFLPYTSVGGKRIWLFILNPKLFFFSEQTKYDSATQTIKSN